MFSPEVEGWFCSVLGVEGWFCGVLRWARAACERPTTKSAEANRRVIIGLFPSVFSPFGNGEQRSLFRRMKAFAGSRPSKILKPVSATSRTWMCATAACREAR